MAAADVEACLLHPMLQDRFEYDVTVQIFALQDGVCERVHVFVRPCALEVKPGMLRVSWMYRCRRAYSLTYKMATFLTKKGVIQYGLFTILNGVNLNPRP